MDGMASYMHRYAKSRGSSAREVYQIYSDWFCRNVINSAQGTWQIILSCSKTDYIPVHPAFTDTQAWTTCKWLSDNHQVSVFVKWTVEWSDSLSCPDVCWISPSWHTRDRRQWNIQMNLVCRCCQVDKMTRCWYKSTIQVGRVPGLVDVQSL
jgi:hypothetical protein